MGAFLGIGNLLASSASSDIAPDQDTSSKLLIIGCRPWDKDLEGVKGLEKASFVDFMLEGARDTQAPEPLSAHFFHVDVNDERMHNSGSFSEFVLKHKGAFDVLVIDWATAQHIKEWTAWPKMKALLSVGGKLVVPLNSYSMNPLLISSASLLAEKVAKMTDNMTLAKFSTIQGYKGNELPADAAYNLLRREKTLESLNSRNAEILIATK